MSGELTRPKVTFGLWLQRKLGLRQKMSDHKRVLATLREMYYSEPEPWMWVEPMDEDRPIESFAHISLAAAPATN